MAAKAIGIDLGTTFSSVGVMKNGRVEIIGDNYGSRLVPSCVAFQEQEILVGAAALDQQLSNPFNTVYGVKRLIGRRYREPCVQQHLRRWPFKVINDDDKPLIEVKVHGEIRHFTPECISSMVLRHLKQAAESYLGHEVADAVITVPANFNDSQRQTTLAAVRMAGLNVLRLLNEPTAAAIAYGLENLHNSSAQEETIMVFDLGGGTLDVSILSVSNSDLFQVKATSGDMHLGGEDLDDCLAQHFAVEFKSKTKCDLSGNAKALLKLKHACERAKRSLSEGSSTSLEIDSLCKGHDFYTKLQRQQFESICDTWLRRIVRPVEQALDNANLNKKGVDQIVLTGGSSRIPKVKQILESLFDGRQISTNISPDEAVVCGAAMMAAKLSGDQIGVNVIITDATSMSLGVRLHDDTLAIVIPRGSPIPTGKISRGFQTANHNDTELKVETYEGESRAVKENNYLGCFIVDGFPAKAKGAIKFDVSMSIDESGILQVTCAERSTGNCNHVTFTKKFNS